MQSAPDSEPLVLCRDRHRELRAIIAIDDVDPCQATAEGVHAAILAAVTTALARLETRQTQAAAT